MSSLCRPLNITYKIIHTSVSQCSYNSTHPALLPPLNIPENNLPSRLRRLSGIILADIPQNVQMVICVAIGMAWFTDRGDKSNEEHNQRQDINRTQTIIQHLNQFLNCSSDKKSVAVWREAGSRGDTQEDEKIKTQIFYLLHKIPFTKESEQSNRHRTLSDHLLLKSGFFNSKGQNKEV